MRIRYALPTAALALIICSAPVFAAHPIPRGTQSKAVSSEKSWTVTLPSINADVAETEPNDDLFTQADPMNCGDVYRPAAIDYPDDIDWIVFSANAGDLLTLGTDADGGDPIGDTIIGLFDSGGNQLAIDDDSGPGFYSLIAGFSAPYTGIYYLGIIAYDIEDVGTYKAFINCETPAPPPANDVCAGAITIPCGPINLSGSTALALNQYDPTDAGCTGYAATGRDVVYKFLANPGDQVTLNYTSSADGSIYIVTDCNDPVNTCLVGADLTFTGQPEALLYTFSSAGTYYLILDSYGTNTSGNWTLTGTNACGVVSVSNPTWGKLKQIYR